MNRCKSLRNVVFLAVVATWAACAQVAEASWVVRPLVGNVSGTISNADIMVSLSGDVVAGYSIYSNPAAGGAVTLARLDGRLFDYSSFKMPANSPSFAMDKFASIYCASNRPGGGANQFGCNVVGTMSDATVSVGNYELVNSTLALDNHGIPAIAGIAAGSMGAVSIFDMHSGAWQTTILGGLSPYAETACFDSNNGPAVAVLSPSQLMLFRGNQGLWQDQTLATDVVSGGLVSVAASSGGAVEFAYPRQGGGIGFGTADGAFISKGLLSLPAGQSIGFHSLAVDPQGNPALVYGNSLTHQLYFARRSTLGTWSAELLPVSADWGNVTFDAAGDPYISAVLSAPGSYRLQLLSPVLPTLANGDFNGDNSVDAADIDLLYKNFGGNFFWDINHDNVVNQADVDNLVKNILHKAYGDANLDGKVDFADFQALLDHWIKPATWAGGDFTGNGVADFADFQRLLDNWNPQGTLESPVPEPATLSLLTLGGLALVRRRM